MLPKTQYGFFYVVFYPYKPEKVNLGRTWSLEGTCRACLEAGT